ncbi:YitT family protein [Clostridium sp. NSJ-49]|uniref:YitT family protein n=1 Tax=Clostridium TaxID=1485 RepID=UPI00164C925B|nr:MULTISPECIES: YitT family protein [unclassified Clostridium]MBC5626107.1 YitT family protein [Clostridium sp. NSJ-49]MCD2502979.1 YitT family protein [Clostridium sp. NSJ-145]
MKKIKEYLLITIGIALTAIALEYFFFPNDIASGGVSGIGLVVNSLTGISTSIVVFVLNILLFVVAFFVLGKSFGAKSIYATIMLSVFMYIIETFFTPGILTENLFLASFFGSGILAMGAAIVFNEGASTGGTSIIAAIISKYTAIGVGSAVLITDSLVCLMAIGAFGVDKGLFGFFSVVMIGILIDKFIDGFNTCKQVFIITNKEKLVLEYITKDINRGCTVLNAQGGFTGSDVKIIYTVLDTKQFITLKKFIKEKNPEAFITVNESAEVLGEGFKSYN